MNKNLIKTLILITILTPLIVFAQNNYPTVPFSQTTITENSELGEVVKYFATWAIIIAGLIVFGSLIAAGIQYLSSAGDPNKMSGARSRILNSFIGLIILLGSYIILATVNPQLTVLEIGEPEAVTSTVAAATPAGTAAIISGETPSANESFITRTRKSLKKSAGDLVKRLGLGGLAPQILVLKKSFLEKFLDNLFPTVSAQLQCIPIEVNFEDFEFDSIFLLKKDGQAPQVKIFIYEKENFQGEAREIFPSDNLEEYGDFILIPKNQLFFTSDLNGEDVYEEVKKNGKISLQKITDSNRLACVSHPPLSISISGSGPGVYLYSSEKGDERYFTGSSNNLSSSDIEFDDQTTKIGIKNDASDDFLAILFEDSDYEGQFRMFFENNELKKRKTANANNNGYTEIQTGNALVWPGGEEGFAFIKDGGDKNGQVIVDKFGKVKEPSSLFAGQIAEDPSVCQEVRLCTGPEYFGDCLVFLPPNKDIDWDLETENVGLVKKPMPLYLPQNIPQGKINVNYVEKNENGVLETKQREAEFSDNIYSIRIKGNCLVALFENKASDTGWENNTPGSNSEVFLASQFDLNPFSITNCRPWGGIGFWQTQSCASAIAVFPVEGFYGGGQSGGGGASRSF